MGGSSFGGGIVTPPVEPPVVRSSGGADGFSRNPRSISDADIDDFLLVWTLLTELTR